MPLRVVHILPAFPFGGAQRLAVDLAVRQSAKGFAPSIIFLSQSTDQGDQAVAAAKSAGIEAHILYGNSIAKVWRLRSVLMQALPNVVHLHMPSPPMLAVLVPQRKFGLVAHLHARPILAVHAATPARRVTALAQRILLAHCDRTIAISQWIAEAWRMSQPRLAPVVVYNGVALPRVLPDLARNDAFTVGMASRLSDRKGVEEFLQAAAEIHLRAPDIRFRIAGDGPLRNVYEQTALELGLGDIMTFDGFVSDMGAFWRSIDLAAFTSPFEPFGLRLIEPVAAGVPVIAYLTGTGADEVIDQCRGVAAVPYGDVSAFADTVLAMRDDAGQRRHMAEDGRADIAKKFETSIMETSVSGVYGQINNGRVSPRWL
jgi:glycosyltransferase involved in cell wall biosynthesis